MAIAINRYGAWAASLCTVALCLSGLLRAQQPDDRQDVHPDFRVESRDLVVLPVTVTDRDGRFVSGVPQEAFTILDNDRPQPIVLFTSEDAPVVVGLLVDSSSSMRSKMGEVVAATDAFAKASNPQDQLFVLEFNESVRDALPDHRMLLARDRLDLQHAVESVHAEGRTALYDGVIEALDRLDASPRTRKALIVISDGGDTASHATLKDVVARAHRSSAVIFTVGLFDEDDPDRNPDVLKNLAHAAGGERYLPKSPGPLMQACQRIARNIRDGYTLAFEAPEHDGAYHKLTVKVRDDEGRRLVVRTRAGYQASVPVKDADRR